jgi:peptidoglycan hydrolase CwlO-like protein
MYTSEDIKAIQEELGKLREQIKSVGVDVAEFDDIMAKITSVKYDMQRLDANEVYLSLPMRLRNGGKLEVYAWHSYILLAELGSECIDVKPLKQCLQQLFSDKPSIYGKFISKFAEQVIRLAKWISENSEKILVLRELEGKVDNLSKKIAKLEEELEEKEEEEEP